MTNDITVDACDREAAWLSVTNDTLPALLASAGGPFQIIQAYWPGEKFAAKKNAIYVQREDFDVPRFSGVRLKPQYHFLLKIIWPVKATAAGIAETEARNLDIALGFLRQRINGLPLDKTHGGRFGSAAETPQGQPVRFRFLDPEVTIPQGRGLRAEVRYAADEFEIFD